ncbi:MAG: carboxy terminal-processing peptidase [Gammaproteobacteria bacterium]
MTVKNLISVLTAIILVSGLFISSNAATPVVALDSLKPEAQHRRATRIITHLIANYHYKRTPLNDSLSEQILEKYLDILDPTKSYLTAEDVAQFSEHATRFDDYLRYSDLQIAYDIFILYRERLEARVEHAIELLDFEFDFEKDESFEFDREDAEWAPDVAALDELWRKRVKNDLLALELAGDEFAEAKKKLKQRYEGIARRKSQLDSEDVFQTFINAYTTSIDPHTAYFSPRTSENFRIRMSLSLEGIGAVLQSEDEYTLVREIVPGGPADLAGDLHSDDRIIGIGQGTDEDIVDVIGWRLDDVVDLIRGPKDSIVRLQILPKAVGTDGPSEVIEIKRDKIKLEEQAAKSSILEVTGGSRPVKIGVVEVPTFYMDFEARARGEKDFRSTTRDVRKLLNQLQQTKIDGLIVDLRSNGGGSLSEATDLTGLFIDKGPVVQVRNSQGRVQLERDTDRGVAYSGPMAVLVNRNSASASEIFAGAIQDYERGLVLGEPTFGKGTVQNLVDLNRYDDSMDGKLGQLKATIAQFFRVAGGSTQHKGVVPDINFPTALSTEDHGERALENALPWDSIAAARYNKAVTEHPSIMILREQHQKRVMTDPAFQALLAQEAAIEEARQLTSISLNKAKRKADHDRKKVEQRARENELRVAKGLPPLPADPGNDDRDATDKDDKDEPEIDILLDEAANVLTDWIIGATVGKRLVENFESPGETDLGEDRRAAHAD